MRQMSALHHADAADLRVPLAENLASGVERPGDFVLLSEDLSVAWSAHDQLMVPSLRGL